MLEVKRTTSECEKETANGFYRVVYSISESKLDNLSVIAYSKTTEEVPGEDGNPVSQTIATEIGSINLNQGVLNMYNFPYSEKYTAYVADFDTIVKEIQESLLTPKAKSK